MKESIAQETRKQFNFIKHEVRKGNEKIMPYLSGSMQKRTKMYKEVARYESNAKIDYELGIISKEEYTVEITSVRLLEQALANYSVY